MNILPGLFDHVIWADARARAAVLSVDAVRPERSQAARLYAHLAGSEHVWLARLEGREPVYAVWPELTLEAAAEISAESLAGLRRLADGDDRSLSRQVQYRTTTGHAFVNTVSDVLSHVALHASYHRGQIAALARQGGGTPIATDYIVFLREVS